MIQSGVEIVDKKVLYAQAVYGEEERQAVLKSLDNPWLANGPLVREFEAAIAAAFGKRLGVAVNSGSSANLVGVGALELPPGSEVITPACTFATTVSTIIQNGLVPVFVDCVVGRYTVDESKVGDAITPRTRAIMVPQLIGGVCNMPVLRELCDEHGLVLIDDSCDTLAPTLHGRTVASYSDITTTSFYGSHIITAMGAGGMVMTDRDDVAIRAEVLRDWGRMGDDREAFENRFSFAIDDIPYDGKFLYGALGYNLKLTEAGAAFGLEQLKRLPRFLERRAANFAELEAYFRDYEEYFYLPYLIDGATTNWLAFPLTIRDDAPFTRYEILQHMESRGVQTRVLFSGNIVRHPAYRSRGLPVAGSLDNADRIMGRGFLVGCHQGMDSRAVDYLIGVAEEFLRRAWGREQ